MRTITFCRFMLVVAFCVVQVPAASLQQVTDFGGSNPNNNLMYLYVPDKVKQHPPILVGLHWCTGSGPDFFSGTTYAGAANQYGFIVIYPSSNRSGGCWDASTVTHGGGGDAIAIISMINYVVHNYNGDSTRVYVTGQSSGGIMTNCMLGDYPDVFQAGAPMSALPFHSSAGGSTTTAAQWGDLVRAAYPGYTGHRPRVQIWHGTVDSTIPFANFGYEIKQWTNVLGVSQTPTTTEIVTPNPCQTCTSWVRTRYKDGAGVVQVEAIQETGQPHSLQIMAGTVVHFFGLDSTSTAAEHRVGALPAENAVSVFQQSDRLLISCKPGNSAGIHLDLYDLFGTKIRTLDARNATCHTFDIPLNGMASGTYLFSVPGNKSAVLTGKFVVR